MIDDENNSVSADNRGVSPVIGVILMVAITVILAAVIGGFVLGLGGDLQSAPQAQISISAAGNGAVDISHEGGDAMASTDLIVSDDSGGGPINFESEHGDEFTVGETVTVSGLSEANDVTVQLIHEPSESVIAEETVDIP